MRKLIYVIGIIGVLAGTFALGVFVGTPPKVAASTMQATNAALPASTIMPFEMMKNSNNLPTENWDAF